MFPGAGPHAAISAAGTSIEKAGSDTGVEDRGSTMAMPIDTTRFEVIAIDASLYDTSFSIYVSRCSAKLNIVLSVTHMPHVSGTPIAPGQATRLR